MATWNSRGLRGSTLEDLINMTNEKYRTQKLALIQKIPTPIKPIQIDHAKHQITLAYFEQRSTVDYIGAVQGLSLIHILSGDAYVDHPSFGHAIITRVLEANGYKVGMIAQPNWKKDESIRVFGRPRLGFIVSGGNMDSMVNHYTVSKKRRHNDAYTPGGVYGLSLIHI